MQKCSTLITNSALIIVVMTFWAEQLSVVLFSGHRNTRINTACRCVNCTIMSEALKYVKIISLKKFLFRGCLVECNVDIIGGLK